MRGLGQLPRRALEALRRRGVAGIVQEAWRRGRRAVLVDAQHLWYELSLDGERPRRALPAGVRLVRGDDADLPRLTANVRSGVAALRRYRAVGAIPWLVLDADGDMLFSCWIFPERMPTIAARDGWIHAPAGSVFLEESATAPAARGRGVAPAAWSALADLLAEDGVQRMITPVERDNAAVQSALAKVGFVAVAAMDTRRRGPRRSVHVDVLRESGAWVDDAVATDPKRPPAAG